MKCPMCSATLPDDAQFCGVCGHRFETHLDSPGPGQGPNQAPGGIQRPLAQGDGIVTASVKDGWEIFKQNPGLLIGMLLVIGAFAGISSAIASAIADGSMAVEQTITQASSLVQTILSAGMVITALRMLRGETVRFSMLFDGFPKVLPLLIGYILMVLAVLAGVILLIVPGVIVALGLSQYMLLIMDRDYNGVDSLKASWQMMSGYKMSLFLLGLLLLGINILGALALVVGLLVSVPVTVCISAAFYERVLNEHPPAIEPQ